MFFLHWGVGGGGVIHPPSLSMSLHVISSRHLVVRMLVVGNNEEHMVYCLKLKTCPPCRINTTTHISPYSYIPGDSQHHHFPDSEHRGAVPARPDGACAAQGLHRHAHVYRRPPRDGGREPETGMGGAEITLKDQQLNWKFRSCSL